MTTLQKDKDNKTAPLRTNTTGFQKPFINIGRNKERKPGNPLPLTTTKRKSNVLPVVKAGTRLVKGINDIRGALTAAAKVRLK